MVFRAQGPGLTQPSATYFPGPSLAQPHTAPFGPAHLPALSPLAAWSLDSPGCGHIFCSVVPRAGRQRVEQGTQASASHQLLPALPMGPLRPSAVQRPRPGLSLPWRPEAVAREGPRCPLVLCVHLSNSFHFSVLAAPTSWPINIFFFFFCYFQNKNLKKKKKQ